MTLHMLGHCTLVADDQCHTISHTFTSPTNPSIQSINQLRTKPCLHLPRLAPAAPGPARRQEGVALPELVEEKSSRIATPSNSNSLEHAVAPKLVEDEPTFDFERTLAGVGLDAANEVRVCGGQHTHEGGELGLVVGGHGDGLVLLTEG